MIAELGPQDWLVFSYLVGLTYAVLQGERTESFVPNLLRVGALFAYMLVGVLAVRTKLVPEHWFSSFLYRTAIYGPVQISYFFFRDILPQVNPGVLDAELYALDLAMFGVEPALILDDFVTPLTTEWFAFFYFGYFFVLAVHVIPLLFFGKSQRVVAEFALGMLVVFCVGHTVYMLVPGYGPYRAMADSFKSTFPQGLWLDLVMETVSSGGAQKDIFPSLHTAGPTFIALFSVRHRARWPFRYTWPLVALYSFNIIIATMFLRWHYLIDVVAGLLLASFAVLLVPRVVDADLRRRARLGLAESWPQAGVVSQPRDGA